MRHLRESRLTVCFLGRLTYFEKLAAGFCNIKKGEGLSQVNVAGQVEASQGARLSWMRLFIGKAIQNTDDYFSDPLQTT